MFPLPQRLSGASTLPQQESCPGTRGLGTDTHSPRQAPMPTRWPLSLGHRLENPRGSPEPRVPACLHFLPFLPPEANKVSQ